MSDAKIAPIGGKKKIRGAWYKKAAATLICTGCDLHPCTGPGKAPWEGLTSDAIEIGGSECFGTIWVATDPPNDIAKTPTATKPKAPKPTGKATWTAKGLPEMSIRTTKRQIRDHLELAIMEINALGTENAKLKNAIARMKRSAR